MKKILLITFLSLTTIFMQAQTYIVSEISTQLSNGTWTKFVAKKGYTTFVNKNGILTINEMNGSLVIKPTETLSYEKDVLIWKGVALGDLEVTVTTRYIKDNIYLWIIDLSGSFSAYITYKKEVD